MDGQILPAQLKLHAAIVQGYITDIRGRLGPPGSKEQRLTDLFSDTEAMGFTLLVTSWGTLAVHPPHERHKFIEKYGIDPDKWWREINFDQDEGERAFFAFLVPYQEQQLGRSYLLLVLGARSGETEAPAARAEESMLEPEPEPELEPKPEPKPEPESELAKAEHTRWQRDRTIEAIKALHPPDGIRPKGTSIQALTNRINKLPDFQENRVSPDTVRLADIEITAEVEAARKK
jgi:hypothetical protein